MKRILPILLSLLLLTGCGGNSADGYQQITQEEAKEMMDTQEVIILDVREQDEYDSGHIPGAVLLPVAGPGTGQNEGEGARDPFPISFISWASARSQAAAARPLPVRRNARAAGLRTCV